MKSENSPRPVRLLVIQKWMRFPLNPPQHYTVEYPEEADWGVHALSEDPQFDVTSWEMTSFTPGPAQRTLKQAARLLKKKRSWALPSKSLSRKLSSAAGSFDVVFAANNSAALSVMEAKAKGFIKSKTAFLIVGLADASADDRLLTPDLPAFRSADLLIALDEGEAEFLRQNTGCRVAKLPFGVDCKYWSRLGAAFLTESDYVASAGRDPLRDWETLAAACRYALEVAAPVKAKPVRGRASITSWGEKTEREYAQCLAQAKMVVVPAYESIRASGMNVVLQAMSMGKSVITAATSSKWWQRAADEGALLVYEPENRDALSDLIEKVWRDPELRRDTGLRAKEWVEKNADSGAFITALKAELVKLTASEE